MGCGLGAVGANAGDFSFEQRNARAKFILRIAVEAFAGEKAGGIAASAGAVIIHCVAASDARRLLSTGRQARHFYA